MKYVIIIPDGAADYPLKELEGKTAFEAANKPHTDKMARAGRVGTVATTPDGMPCGSDVCSMSLLGYDPMVYHTGRAPLEAQALGIELGENDWIFRVNFVTVIDGLMQDHSAGHISEIEAAGLLKDFKEVFNVEDMVLHQGVSYRNIMVDKSGTRDWSKLISIPPHDIPGEEMRLNLPVGTPNAGVLQQMIADSQVFFESHEINLTRKEMGELPATHVWPWGQGTRPNMPSFKEKYGLKGAMITAVDLLAGISSFIGWDRLDVPGQTSYHDNNYAASGEYAIKAIDDYDIVCVHIEAPDEASHSADAHTKVAAIEAMDQHVVGPILKALEEKYPGDYRVLYLPDHYTRVETRKHDATPVPFAMFGRGVVSSVERLMTEAEANASDLQIEYGHELMEFFIKSGLKQ